MVQFEVPAIVPADPQANVTDLLADRVKATPQLALFAVPEGDGEVQEIQVKRRDANSNWIWGAIQAPGRILSEQIERNYTPEYRAWQSEHEIPVGEYGKPEDIANLVCFLVSPRARYITGAVIPVDGGLRRYQF